MSHRPLTDEEQRWIRSAQRLFKRMPESLTLFGCESGLVLFCADPDSRGLPLDVHGCVDSNQAVCTLTRNCDGGAW